MTPHPEWLVPDWPAPPNVHAFTTTRAGGVSEGEHASMNLGRFCGDMPERVMRNRELLRAHLPGDPPYLAQVHGIDVADLDGADRPEKADAAITRTPRCVAGVLTADCMPLLLTDRAGSVVAAAHAGWRGMAAGVIENAARSLRASPEDILAWMGPTIGPDAFEVGPEVREAFLHHDSGAGVAFKPHREDKYLADLYQLARRRLAAIGVIDVHGGGFCTFHEPDRFFSYRRQKQSGRMGTFIWRA